MRLLFIGQAVLIALKVAGVLAISWPVVFIPAMVAAGVAALVLGFILVAFLVTLVVGKKARTSLPNFTHHRR